MEAYLALGGKPELPKLFIRLALPREPFEQQKDLHVFLLDQEIKLVLGDSSVLSESQSLSSS